MPALAIVSAVVGLAGTGLSYASQMSAAKTEATFSALNAQAGAQQAQQQSAIAAMQANLQGAQAQAQQQSAFNNAEALRAQADADAKIGQENIRRGRDEFARQLAAANAQAGGSGVNVATGSPLDFLMKAADTEQQQEAGDQYGINANRVAGYRQAAGEELQGNVQGMNQSLYQLQSLQAIKSGRQGVAQAKLEGYAGAARAQGMQNSALGGLVGGIGGSLTSFSNTPWFKKRWG